MIFLNKFPNLRSCLNVSNQRSVYTVFTISFTCKFFFFFFQIIIMKYLQCTVGKLDKFLFSYHYFFWCFEIVFSDYYFFFLSCLYIVTWSLENESSLGICRLVLVYNVSSNFFEIFHIFKNLCVEYTYIHIHTYRFKILFPFPATFFNLCVPAIYILRKKYCNQIKDIFFFFFLVRL